jgi:uncharacterized protein
MNKVVHFEVPYDDRERATKFYKDVFGWKINPIPEMSYDIVHTVEVDDKQMPKESGAINGGMYKRGEQGAKSPVIVIDVPSVDEHIKKVNEAGGKVVMAKRQVGDMGFYAQVKDTEGNVIGIWEMILKQGEGNEIEEGDSGSDE